MTLLDYFLLFILSFSLVEILLFFLILFLRGKFQWLITWKDNHPKIERDILDKVVKKGFDSQLGWVRKPDTSGEEIAKTSGEASGEKQTTSYSINSKGARCNPAHESLVEGIATFGDSFTFCRQVNDDETWQWYLSEMTNENVSNYGVGNYGIDQGLIRFKMEEPNLKAKVVIMGVVPETIVRILSVWKHYYEYGNIYGFKPRFKVEEDKLKLIKNEIDSPEKFHNLKLYLDKVKLEDHWYTKKFRKDILTFPFILSLFKSRKRNVPLILALLKKELFELFNIKNKEVSNSPWNQVLAKNSEFCRTAYDNKDAVNLLVKIVEDFAQFATSHNFKPAVIIFPYLADIVHVRDNDFYYSDALDKMKKRVVLMDPMSQLLNEKNIEELYSSDFYGGHLTAKGNEYMAHFIHAELKQQKII